MTTTISGELMGLEVSPLVSEPPEWKGNIRSHIYVFLNYNLLNISTNSNILN